MLDLATQMLEQGKAQLALPLLTEHCTNHPRDAAGWFLLGASHHQLQQLPDALQTFERVLSIEPRHIQARLAKGVVLSALGRPQEALQVFRKALHLAPNDAQLLLNIAVLLEQNGDLQGALERYEQALRDHPNFAAALLNRGALLLRMQRLDEALLNNRKLIELQPEWESAHYNLGETLLALGHWNEALVACQRALALNANSAQSHFAAGLALSMLRCFDQAQQEFAAARAIEPEIFEQNIRKAVALTGGVLQRFTPEVVYLLKQATRLDNCDWNDWDVFVKDFEYICSNALDQSEPIVEPALLFRACALPISADTRLTIAKSVSANIRKNTQRTFSHARRNAPKLKIGYVSPDFRKHPIATVTRQLYAQHDRSQFEVYGYSLHPGDGSTVRRDIEQGCDVFRELSGIESHAAAELIHRDSIDILIDLAGYTTHARPEIFAMRPAPLQVSYLGFLHTTGADWMDYLIADPIVIPPAASEFYTENIAYVSNSYFLFDDQQSISQSPISRESLGLPSHGFVFCCHNSSYKITPADFDLWMRILARTPDSVLWLYRSNEAVASNLRKEAQRRGVNPGRLVFADFAAHDEYLARYRLADLFLDTLYYNAQTTAAEALWAGLPVLTCPGTAMASRVAAGLLTAVNLKNLICDTRQQFEDLACHLATHPGELNRIRATLHAHKFSNQLFNTECQVRKLEALYRAMWQRHLAGQAAQTLHPAP